MLRRGLVIYCSNFNKWNTFLTEFLQRVVFVSSYVQVSYKNQWL